MTRRHAAVGLVLVLLAAALYELLIAVGAVGVGSVSGDGAPGEGWVFLAAAVATVAGVVLALWELGRPAGAQVVAVGIAAATFVAVRLYTYDPYYAPTLRRMSDGGLVPPGWVFFVLALPLAAVALQRVARTSATGLAALVLVLCFFTAALESAGH